MGCVYFDTHCITHLITRLAVGTTTTTESSATISTTEAATKISTEGPTEAPVEMELITSGRCASPLTETECKGPYPQSSYSWEGADIENELWPTGCYVTVKSYVYFNRAVSGSDCSSANAERQGIQEVVACLCKKGKFTTCFVAVYLFI